MPPRRGSWTSGCVRTNSPIERVEDEHLNPRPQREAEEGRARVQAVPRRDERRARLERRRDAVLVHALLRRAVVVELLLAHDAPLALVLEDAEDRARRHAGVDVRRAVERIEDGNVPRGLVDDRLEVVLGQRRVVEHVDQEVLLLGGDHAHFPGEAQRVLEHLVRDHVELLLLLALHVHRALRAHHPGDVRARDEAGDRLDAVWIDDISVSMSASSGFARHTSHMYRDSVTPV